MSQTLHTQEALNALTAAERALDELDRGCCEPGRSPRMAALADTLSMARSGLAHINGDDSRADVVIQHLEDAGRQIGALQVTCCAPARMPLYAELLESLMKTQRSINRSLSRGH